MEKKYKSNMVLVGIIVLFFIGLFLFIDNGISTECYTSEYILINQYIDNTNSSHGGNCLDGCLFMEVLEVKNANYIRLKDFSNYQNEIKRLFFSGEIELRKDLQINKTIYIKWCNTNYGDRIRGVTSNK